MNSNKALKNETNLDITEKENFDQTKPVGKTVSKAQIDGRVKSAGTDKTLQREQLLTKYIQTKRETYFGAGDNKKLQAKPLAPSRILSAPILKPVVGKYNSRVFTTNKEIKKGETVNSIKINTNLNHLTQKTTAKNYKTNNIPNTKRETVNVLIGKSTKSKITTNAEATEDKRAKNETFTLPSNIKTTAPTKVHNTQNELINKKEVKCTNQIKPHARNILKYSSAIKPAEIATKTYKKQFTTSVDSNQTAAKVVKHVLTESKPTNCKNISDIKPSNTNYKDNIKNSARGKAGIKSNVAIKRVNSNKVLQVPENVKTPNKHFIKTTDADKTTKFLSTIEASHEIFQTPAELKSVKSFYTFVTSTKYSPLSWTFEDLNHNISPIEPIKSQYKNAPLQLPNNSFLKSGVINYQKKFNFVRYSVLETPDPTDTKMLYELQANEELKTNKIMEFGKRVNDKISAIPDASEYCQTPKARVPYIQLAAAKDDDPNNNNQNAVTTMLDAGSDTNPLPCVNVFQKQLNSETERLKAMCDAWEQYKTENLKLLITKGGDDLINVAIGQTNLLTKKKFLQFEKLIGRCRNALAGKGALDDGKLDNKLVTVDDLDGYWSLVCLQIDNINARFENLTRWRDNGWVDPDMKPIQPKPPTKVSSKPKSSSAMTKPKVSKTIPDVSRKFQVVNQNKFRTTKPGADVYISKPTQERCANSDDKNFKNCVGAIRTSVFGKYKVCGENLNLPNDKNNENSADLTSAQVAVKDKGCVPKILAPGIINPLFRAPIGVRSVRNATQKSNKGNDLLNTATTVKDQQQFVDPFTSAQKLKSTKTTVLSEEKSKGIASNKVANNPNLLRNKSTGISNLTKKVNQRDCAADKNTQVIKKEPKTKTDMETLCRVVVPKS